MRPTTLPQEHTTPADFSHPADRDGLVIYFSVNGKPMLFNGHVGTFHDSLPDWADAALKVVTGLGPDQRPEFGRWQGRHRKEVAAFCSELELFRNGRHPALSAEEHQTSFHQRGTPRDFNVLVGQGCNLRCRYCVNQQGTFGGRPSLMSTATARQVLEFIRGTAQATDDGAISVNLLGGEPMLASEAVYVLARGLQDLNHANPKTEIRLILFTNGTIYDQRIFEVIAERPDLCTVVVSLDAFPDAHDRNRPFTGSRGGSYAVVLANIHRLIKENIPYSVTCVVPKPYDYIGAAEELHRVGVTRLELKDVIDYIYGGSAMPSDCTGDFGTWRTNYLAYTDYFLDYLHAEAPATHVDRFVIIQDYGPVLNSRHGFHRTLACGVADEKIAIAADGRILPCEALLGHGDFALGHVRDGLAGDRVARFEQLLLAQGQFRTDDAKCRRCFAKLICGGGCYAQSYDKTGTFVPCEEPTCRIIREKARIDLYYLARLREEHPAFFSEYGGIVD